MTLTIVSAVAAMLWATVLLLPFRPWSTRERLEAAVKCEHRVADLSDVTAVVPARNEASRIADTVTALRRQGRGIEILVVDDGSEDGTSAVVEGLALDGVSVLRAGPLPRQWTGKVWAQSRAESRLTRPLLLLLDADILLSPGAVPALKETLETTRSGLVSVMAALPMRDFWERLLMPAFVFFFKLLYPFGLANAPRSRIAAAAGGCVLMHKRVLEDIGGFAAVKDALIDDCALARRVKDKGHRVWIGLTHSAASSRRYPRLADIWNMVARTAFVQLRCSAAMLLLCTLIMTVAFIVPMAGLLAQALAPSLFSALAIVLMSVVYIPTLKYYRIHPALGLTLPLAGVLFLAMTWTSALRYWTGERSVWHGRVYRA